MSFLPQTNPSSDPVHVSEELIRIYEKSSEFTGTGEIMLRAGIWILSETKVRDLSVQSCDRRPEPASTDEVRILASREPPFCHNGGTGVICVTIPHVERRIREF